MKTQNYGTSKCVIIGNDGYRVKISEFWQKSTEWTSPPWKDYKVKRENGSTANDPNWQFPQDGTITWVKGKVRGDYIYGEYSDAHECGENEPYEYGENGPYYYEARYNEGQGDRKWMKKKDKNYLNRLANEEKLEKEKEEPEEFKGRQQAISPKCFLF